MSDSEPIPLGDKVIAKIERTVPDAVIRDAIKSSELLSVINNPDKQDQKRQLDALDLQTLRFLHRIALPALEGGKIKVFGCIGLYTETVLKDTDLIDALNPSVQMQLHAGDKTSGLDFLPFGEAGKVERYATESLFLLATDGIRALAEISKKESPDVIITHSNPHMGRFMVRNLNFHAMSGTLVANRERIPMSSEQLVEAISTPDNFQQTILSPNSAFVELTLFTTKAELSSREITNRYQRLKTVAYARLSGDKSDPTKIK
jgi:hypothetical protein